jgi:hypothetical protein
VIGSARLILLCADQNEFAPLRLLKKPGAKEDTPDKLAIAAHRIPGFLKEGPKRKEDIDREYMLARITERTFRRAADTLRIIKARHSGGGPGSHTTWELPPARPIKTPSTITQRRNNV